MPKRPARPRNIRPWKLTRKPVPKPTRVIGDKREKALVKHKKKQFEEEEEVNR